MKKLITTVILFWFWLTLHAQFTDSNLPIVIISTGNGSTIPDQPRVLATMKIIYRGPGERNYLIDQDDPAKLNYNGKILIEIRGSSSQALPKKQYGLTTVQADNTTNNNVSLLGMPSENDWVLNGLAFDASLIRDYLSYNLSAKLGNYAPRGQYCEVVINNVYQGLYSLQEKVKIDNDRVDIIRIEPTDNTLPNLSGGYLTKADKVTTEDPSAWTMPTYLGTFTDFVHEKPNSIEITLAQHQYIISVFSKLASSAGNHSLSNGYPSVIDVPSFVDFILVNELAANVDAYQFSTFFHKDRNGKLRAGPLWDLNLTFGNDLFFWGFDRSKTFTWQFDNGDNIGPRFWRDLYNNTTFRCYLSRRWNELIQPGQPLNLESVNTYIDEIVAHISEAVVRENDKWGTISNHESHIIKIKQFLPERITWMTENLGSFSACSDVVTPQLVINRIDYHPGTTAQFPDDNDQEFIEIINNSDNSVSLTGIYFSGTGFVYQFKEGAVLQPNGIIQLANNRSVFKNKFGYEPYGEFTHNLSNGTQKLTLADGFGNVIDEVEYSDTTPWPMADGNGMHLKLTDPSLDNNDGTNWVATDELIVSTEIVVDAESDESAMIEVYPNPADQAVHIISPVAIVAIQLTNVQGKLLQSNSPNSPATTFDLAKFPPGVYLLTIKTKTGSFVKKVVRQ